MTEDIPARAARIQRELFGTEPPEPSALSYSDLDLPIQGDNDPEWAHRGSMVDAYNRKRGRLVNKNDRNRDSIEGVVAGIIDGFDVCPGPPLVRRGGRGRRGSDRGMGVLPARLQRG